MREGAAPGMVGAIWRETDPDLIRTAACGERRKIPTSLPMTTDTIFDLASISKVMGVATLAAVLVDRGWIGWHHPVQSFFPGYAHRDITLAHLLSHTAGLVWWKPFYEEIRKEFAPTSLPQVPIEARQDAMRRRILALTPESAPGEKMVYSDPSALLLGFCLEEALGMTLLEAMPRYVWEPMGVIGAHYRPITKEAKDDMDPKVAATEACPWRGSVLQGQVHDDNAWSMGGYAGHAGVFGTALDVMHFGIRLLEGFLSAATLRAAWTQVDKPPGCGRTLGWDTPSGPSPSAGQYFSSQSVGHTGFTGTSLWIDPEKGRIAVLLSNRVHPTRENPLFKDFRPRFHDKLFQ